MMCQKIRVIVDDLKKEHGEEKIKFTTINISTPNAAKELKDAGLDLHGIIAKGPDGKLVKAIEGHSYGKPKVDEVVETLLAN